VRDGNGRDQGQPQPAAGIAGPLSAGETLECARRHVLGETAALIGDMQPEQLAIIASSQRDRATAVLQRVGDEIIQRLCGPVGITKQPATRRHVADHDLPASCPGGGPCAGGGRLEQHARLQRPRPQRKPSIVRLGQHQNVVRQPADAPNLIRGRPERRAEFAGIPVPEQRQLDFCAQRGQRRPQLMAGGADQRPLLCLRSLAATGRVADMADERLAGTDCGSHLVPPDG